MSNRSIQAQAIRPYKVEIFGLQDDYIGTLQSFEDTFLGQIIEPRLVVKDDGTQTFTCKIPKFYVDPRTNSRVTNPRWMDAENNVLAENIRVLKVFINLGDKPEDIKVFPLMITSITDRRDANFSVYKSIEATGLAFSELGKQGYKLELNSFTIENDNAQLVEKGQKNTFVDATIQYWLDKVFPNIKDADGKIVKWLTPWCYEIHMDYSYYSENRLSTEVYEDAYVSAWEGSKELQPAGVEKARIKQRQIECSNSNKYNITQDIAQTFGVFCRYEYKTDLNGKFVREWTDENGNAWTGKRVIFYNKAIKSENPYVIDYEKNLQTIERKSEGSNIYSKLYVKPIEASNMTNGYVTIADVAANPSYDEFILNFDYLRSISAINDWQFQKVKEYECNIRRINEKLALVAPVLEKTQAEMNDWEAKVSLNEKQVANAEENRVRYNELYNNTEKEAYRTKTNPRRASIGYDQFRNYYFEFTSYEDVSLNSIEAYLNYPTDTPKEYKDGVTIAESQADANFKVSAAQKINYGPEPTAALNLPDNDSQFYVVVDEDNFLRKLYFKMTPKRQAAFVREFGDFNTENHIPWQMYLTFKYHPANKYAARVNQYEALRQSLEDETSGIKASYNKKKQEYEAYVLEQQELLSKKEELNLQIENTLGPALREGYWNPSEYKGALRGHNESIELFFDDIPKEGEEELTKVYIGVDQKETYRNYLVVDDKYNKDFREGDFSSLSITLTSKIDGKTPLTLFNGPDAGFDVILTRLNKEDPVRRTIVFNKDLSNYLPNVSGSSSVSAKYSFSFNDKTEGQDIILTVDTFEKAKRTQVWPRITINEKNIQYNADSLVIGKKDAAKEEDIPLRKFYDYYYHIENGYPTYTFKITENNPFINFDNLTYNVSYETSTANEMLYLDARQVAKDNSIPRYSYSLTLSNLPHDFKHIDLSQLVYINDYSLGVHAATGYVNEITYHLDEPWEDEINVQNYKTKFEDLFNTIVAQSEAMKNGQPAISNVVNNFGADGTIKGSVIQAALANNDFYFDYSATGVEITPTDGIILTNNKPYANGVYGQVVLQGGGIFISNSIDANGNRIWSTGITPDGINANLLTAGQINTDLIKIYSGDDIAFSWNKDGIYAYCDNGNGYDETKYVRFSREGLQATHNNVDRVSLTWDGLFMRNDNGERTFELDTDGNILMSGTLQSFDYRPGILGTGWCIDRTGTAEFNNVKVRGIISASVFNYEETTAVGGQIWVAPTLILTGAQTDKAAFGISTTSGKMTINLRGESCFPIDKPTDAAGREWNFKDLINFNGKIVKINDASEVYEIKNLRVTISNSTYKQQNIASRISSGSLFLDSEFVFDDDLNGIVDWIPDNLLYTTDGVLASKEKHEYFFKHLSEYKGLGDWHLIYNGSADAGTEGVLITAMAAKGPYIDVYDDTPVKNRFKELLGANATEGMAIPPAVRLGKLDGLKDNPLLEEYFGEDNTPRGYGLYSDNVYLTGAIYATSGRIGSLSIDEVQNGVNAIQIKLESSAGLVYKEGIKTNTQLQGLFTTAKGVTLGNAAAFESAGIDIDTIRYERSPRSNTNWQSLGSGTFENSLYKYNLDEMSDEYRYRIYLKYIYKEITNEVYSNEVTFTTSGTRITDTIIEYAISSNGIDIPTSGWSTTIQQTKMGEYLWTRTTIKYSDGTSKASYSVAAHGEKGDAGEKALEYDIIPSVTVIERDLITKISPGTLTYQIQKTIGETKSYITNLASAAMYIKIGNITGSDVSIVNSNTTSLSYSLADYIQGSTYGNVDSIKLELYTSSNVLLTSINIPIVLGDDLRELGKIQEGEVIVNDGKVYAEAIVSNAILTRHITAGAVTANKIAANTITAGQIAAGAITAEEIAADAITSGKIAANAVTAGKIAANAIEATNIKAGAVTVNKLHSDVGATLDISSNNNIGLYVNTNGVTTSSVVLNNTGITMKSGGKIDIVSGSSINIASGGKFTIDSTNFKVKSDGSVELTGKITAGSGEIGGWKINTGSLSSGSGTNAVYLSSDTSSTYAFWAGNATAANAPFRVSRDGTIYATKFYTIQEDSTYKSIDLTGYPLWKLNYSTVKNCYVNNGTLTIELSNKETINFKKAAGNLKLFTPIVSDNASVPVAAQILEDNGTTVIKSVSGSATMKFDTTSADNYSSSTNVVIDFINSDSSTTRTGKLSLGTYWSQAQSKVTGTIDNLTAKADGTSTVVTASGSLSTGKTMTNKSLVLSVSVPGSTGSRSSLAYINQGNNHVSGGTKLEAYWDKAYTTGIDYAKPAKITLGTYSEASKTYEITAYNSNSVYSYPTNISGETAYNHGYKIGNSEGKSSVTGAVETMSVKDNGQGAQVEASGSMSNGKAITSKTATLLLRVPGSDGTSESRAYITYGGTAYGTGASLSNYWTAAQNAVTMSSNSWDNDSDTMTVTLSNGKKINVKCTTGKYLTVTAGQSIQVKSATGGTVTATYQSGATTRYLVNPIASNFSVTAS